MSETRLEDTEHHLPLCSEVQSEDPNLILQMWQHSALPAEMFLIEELILSLALIATSGSTTSAGADTTVIQ